MYRRNLKCDIGDFKKTLRKLEHEDFIKNTPPTGDTSKESFYIIREKNITADISHNNIDLLMMERISIIFTY